MELFAADGHDAGGCERVTGKSGMRPARLPHSANVHRRTFAPLGLLLFRTRQTRPSPFGCYGSGYSTFALNQDAPSAASYIVTVPPP